jgi:hypothetical protein
MLIGGLSKDELPPGQKLGKVCSIVINNRLPIGTGQQKQQGTNPGPPQTQNNQGTL